MSGVYYRITIPRYKPIRSEGYNVYTDLDYNMIYIVRAASAREAISKLPPAESQDIITSVEYLGSIYVIE
jgi:hypothetical protein